MKRGLARKLLVAFVLVVVGATAPAWIALGRRLGREVQASERDALVRNAEVLAAELARAPSPTPHDWVRAMAKTLSARVTLLDEHGTVTADSDVVPADIARVENHATRIEVRDALAGRIGEDVRHSTTVGRDLLYVAVPVRGAPLRVLRLAAGLERVDQAIAAARRAVWGAAATALTFAIILGVVLSRTISGPLESMTRAARAMTTGDFTVEVPREKNRTDEIDSLASAFVHLRDELAARLRELRQEREKVHAVVESMNEGVLLVVDDRIALANPAFARLTGANAPIEGRTPIEVSRIPSLIEAIQAARDTREPQIREAQALDHLLRIDARAIGDAGRPQILVTVIDMTDAKRLERMRREFVANASHELRTPVAAIAAAAETLSLGAAEDPEARRSFVEILLRHADRLTRLTADLLDIARLEGGYRPRHERFFLEEAKSAALTTLAPRAAARGITLATHGDFAIEVSAERAAVEQILVNLMDNAIKYAPSASTVSLSSAIDGDRLTLSIQDQGPGIAAEHLPRLFERFYRVDDARARDLGGTGLGLSIVKHLALANGGDVGVESTVGQGSRFWVVLPRH